MTVAISNEIIILIILLQKKIVIILSKNNRESKVIYNVDLDHIFFRVFFSKHFVTQDELKSSHSTEELLHIFTVLLALPAVETVQCLTG